MVELDPKPNIIPVKAAVDLWEELLCDLLVRPLVQFTLSGNTQEVPINCEHLIK